jgi:site-specific recombinase XerD
MTDPEDLQPLDPRDAVQMYKQDRERELSDATLQSHGYRLERFLEWCEIEDIDNLNNVTGRDLHRFKLFRKAQVNDVTLKSQMDTLRVFIRFCQSVDGCIDGLSESINSPSLGDPDNRGTDVLPREKAEAILAYYDKYRYGRVEHALFRLLWESGMRMGSARGIDLEHYHPREEYVEVRHNPDTDTPLKNAENGERDVALSSRTCRLLDDYIEEYRWDRRDEFDRRPLFTTKHGRVTKNTIRNWTYRITRPCTFGRECPHDRDPEDCEGMDNMTASKCPSSTAPHSIRHGAITDYLNRDIDANVVSERLNVGMDTISEHYDHRSTREKMNIRRQHLDF